MSQGLLYHAFGIRGYQYQGCRFEGGRMIVQIKQARKSLCCSDCGCEHVFARGTVERRFRSLPIGSRAVFIEFAVPRVRCRDCGLVRQVVVQFADAQRRSTKRFERYVLELLKFATVADVARHLGLSWDSVRDIEQRFLQKQFSKPKLKHVIMKRFNEKLSDLRRDLHREATAGLQRKVLKGTRWLLLKNWEQPGPITAEFFLDDWCTRAEASGIKILKTLAKTLRGHRNGLRAWYRHPISTGPLEGINNKIKTMQRQSYGFRNSEYRKLKILAIHRSKYALIG